MNQSFTEKVSRVILSIFFIKIIIILIYSNNKVNDFVTTLAIFFALIMFVIWMESNINDALKNNNSQGRNITVNDSLFDKLHQKYRDLATKYENENDHKKASFIYMKLLNSNYEAAEVLERGKLYNEAAIIYHKKVENKTKAAECYENGKSYQAAIKLYLELEEHEKLGDLYRKINKELDAVKYYNIKVEDYKKNNQYVKASLLLKQKLFNNKDAQELLLKGWESNYDAKNCLNNYFSNIKDIEKLEKEIKNIYKNYCKTHQYKLFLDLLKLEFNKDESLQIPTREIAYEIISKKATEDKNFLNDLSHFKPNDKLIKKDVMKYKVKK